MFCINTKFDNECFTAEINLFCPALLCNQVIERRVFVLPLNEKKNQTNAFSSPSQAFQREQSRSDVVFCQVHLLWAVSLSDTLWLSHPRFGKLPHQELQLCQPLPVSRVSYAEESIISSSWANRSKALVTSGLTTNCCCKNGRRQTRLYQELLISDICKHDICVRGKHMLLLKCEGLLCTRAFFKTF